MEKFSLKVLILGAICLSIFACLPESTAEEDVLDDKCIGLNFNLYNDGTCDTICADPDPDCREISSSVVQSSQTQSSSSIDSVALSFATDSVFSSSSIEALSSIEVSSNSNDSILVSSSVAPISSSTVESSSSVVIPSSSSTIDSLIVSSSSITISSSSSVIASSSSIVVSNELVLWEPSMGSQTATGGYWFMYDDKAEGGTSSVLCNGIVIDPTVTFIEACQDSVGVIDIGFDMTAAIDGGGFMFGYSAVGFDLIELNASGKDLSAYAKIRVEYNTTKPMFMKLIDDEVAVGYASHRYKLPVSSSVLELPWSSFKQPSWGSIIVSVNDIVANLRKIQFEASSDNFTGLGNFTVHRVVLVK